MTTTGTTARPRFTVITAVYNVARYLDEFIASLGTQSFEMSRVEIIAVDDGSTDDSLQRLQAWANANRQVTVLTKPNGGQSSARNLGLEHATGEWVTFPDPDDYLEPDYFAAVDAFLTAHPDAVMAATARIFLNEASGSIVDDHPLRRMFAGDRFVDLDEHPEFFQGSAPAAFVRTDLLDGLRFDERVRPNFEDGHFCSRYLLHAGHPLVGFVGSARYIYRKRADGSSTLQGGQRTTERFLAVPRHGYLELLQAAAGATGTGRPPAWLQNLIIYELSYYFMAELEISGTTAAHGEVAAAFVVILREIATLLDPELVATFGVARFDSAWRDILLHGLDGADWVTPYAVLDRFEDGLARISYRFVGPAPTEQIHVDGAPAVITHGKVWVHEYFEVDLLHERVAWVQAGDRVEVVLNGSSVPVLPAWPDPNPVPPRVRSIRRPTRIVRRLASTWPVRHRFRDAWCLIDRVHNADDNAERLFRYLRAERRDVNAWFVLEKGTPDWERLVRDGHRRRLVAHGGVRWRWLMLNCRHVISSHVDPPVHRPGEIIRMRREPQWRFSFLQHGVIKDDLSRWLNPKDVDLFVTSTPDEQASVVADGTHYSYTTKEARMTGLPRFDRLRELGAAVPAEQRRRVLICPTWRYWLAPPPAAGSQRRSVTVDFAATEFAQCWLGLLRDDRLAALAAERGLRIGFLPHPNLQAVLDQLDLPSWVEPLRFEGTDVQQLIAESTLMVTDYSSMSFNAGYLDRSVVYFQFDAERVDAGGHVGRPGYYDYRTLGFGPVTATIDETIAAITAAVEAGAPTVPYQARIDAAFPQRDGRCCERTTAAIEALGPRQPMTGVAVGGAVGSTR